MAQRQPDREVVPPVQRLRIRYAKTGRMRFTSHRDFQRALERALRRARVPMAYSAGFSPHPRISYANSAPTGAASDAEYVEIAVVERCDPRALAAEVNRALPDGMDIVEVVQAGTPDLMNRLAASTWEIVLPGADGDEVAVAWSALLGAPSQEVSRMTKSGLRTFDVRPAVISGQVVAREVAGHQGSQPGIAIVLRHQTPLVRPDDLLLALKALGFTPPEPPILHRLAQGPLESDGTVGDPLRPDWELARAGTM